MGLLRGPLQLFGGLCDDAARRPGAAHRRGNLGEIRLVAADQLDLQLDEPPDDPAPRHCIDLVDPGGKVFIDKHPLNTLKLPLIARMFPDARILFACRDPRDVVLSCFRRRFKMNAAMYQLLSLAGKLEAWDEAVATLEAGAGSAPNADMCAGLWARAAQIHKTVSSALPFR